MGRWRMVTKPTVLSISGGKDSAALALHLRELGIEPAARVWMDTGWEHEATYRYIDEVLEPALGPITRLRVEVPLAPGWEEPTLELEAMLGRVSPMVRLCVWKGAFPGQGTRWCTQALKTVPAARYLAGLDDDVQNAVGIRAEESRARAGYAEREPMPRVEVNPVVRLPGEGRWIDLDHVEQWRPILQWTVEDVVAIHRRHGLPMNPLYRLGASRVGCWPCIFANKDDLRVLADHGGARLEVLRRLELLVSEKAQVRKEARVARGEADRKVMPPLCWFMVRDPLMREKWKAEQGGIESDETMHLCVPVDQVLAWARTRRGGLQMDLEAFGAPDRDWACSRWGYCETRPKEGS